MSRRGRAWLTALALLPSFALLAWAAPHALRGFIPASISQLLGFFTPDGKIENFCADGRCDASEPNEIPLGAAAPCDPL